ncbi:MAG: hypothetical protein ACKVQW_09925 [Pyrinomonadaceae bacterium]
MENNLIWLRSFGCEIDRQDEIIYVRHHELREFNARLVMGSSDNTVRKLTSLLGEINANGPLIYVDESFNNDSIQASLARNGFKQISANRIKAASIPAETSDGNLKMELARATDHEEWSALYSQGFARRGKDAELDRVRWRRSFEKPEILHWYFSTHGQNVGVCQTCFGAGVVGLYSFTLLPASRTLRASIGAARSLRNEMARRSEHIIYFERVRNWVPRVFATPTSFAEVRTLRRFRVYAKR